MWNVEKTLLKKNGDMRKLIDINEEDGTYEKLQILAIKAKKDLKNYIQDVLSEHAIVGGKK